MAKTYNSAEEITRAFKQNGWGNNISFSELTLEEAIKRGHHFAVNGIKKGRKYYKMTNCGNIYDDIGKIALFNVNAKI